MRLLIWLHRIYSFSPLTLTVQRQTLPRLPLPRRFAPLLACCRLVLFLFIGLFRALEQVLEYAMCYVGHARTRRPLPCLCTCNI